MFSSRGTKDVDCGPIMDTVGVADIKIWFRV